MDDLTRNEASRLTDRILSAYGRPGTGGKRLSVGGNKWNPEAEQNAEMKKEVKVNDESAR